MLLLTNISNTRLRELKYSSQMHFDKTYLPTKGKRYQCTLEKKIKNKSLYLLRKQNAHLIRKTREENQA